MPKLLKFDENACYRCPRCGHPLNKTNIKKGKCKCGLEFKVNDDTDLSDFDTDMCITKFNSMVAGHDREMINYGESFKDMIKARLGSIVIFQKNRWIQVFRVDDCEITCFLFRLWVHTHLIKIEFDIVLPFEHVVADKPMSASMKSMIKTKDFEYALELATWLYETRKRFTRGKKAKRGISPRFREGNDGIF